MTTRTRVAVLFGGLSSEHDVSVLSGLEALEALDPAKYEGFPVYIGLDGQWWVGDALRHRTNYLPDLAVKRQLTRVELAVGNARTGGQPVLRAVEKSGLFGGRAEFAFDVVLPVLHGSWGEDGTLQGLLTAENIPFAGGNVGAMAMTIHKMWTLGAAQSVGLPVLPTMYVPRGADVEAKLQEWQGKYPVFVKPNFLGSSIGARMAVDAADAAVAVREVFRVDTAALVQPQVPDLVEYNVAVRRLKTGEIVTSAIERPLRKGESYSFKDKYLSQGLDSKLQGGSSPGLVSATRVMHPPELAENGRDGQIRGWATALFEVLDLAGAPRLDFLCNNTTGDIFFNEINPIPGSLGYFLWEQATPAVGFTELLDDMICEAQSRIRSHGRVVDPVANGGAIFRKRGV